MSELNNTRPRADLRWQLLTGASALVLGAYIGTTNAAKAEDADRPTVWIELGPQIERMGTGQEIFNPVFLTKFAEPNFESPLSIQRQPRYAVGGEGKITLEPTGSDWIFSISARYGRSKNRGSRYQQLQVTAPGALVQNLGASTSNAESHAVIDFQAGKDVGLGMFLASRSSNLSLGVRFAQFTSRRNVHLSGLPDFSRTGSQKYGSNAIWHRYFGTVEAEHDFRGVGPSFSWDASRSVLGKGGDGGITLDWGVNAAILFGRQTARGDHKQTGLRYDHYRRTNALVNPPIQRITYTTSGYHHVSDINRSRSVVVPNLGGFAGLSFRYPNAKISLGYRADFFFGAMDGGIDTRKTYNQSFYGPFATVSIGLGG